MVTYEVSGPRACFTRPEFKAERLTYDVLTPTAAVGIAEAVFWKPQFKYRTVRIEVLKPIKKATELWNEVTIKGPVKSGCDSVLNRAQRQTEMLRDVRYRVTLEIILIPEKIDPKRRRELTVTTYENQFNRRVTNGKSFKTPCLGLKEFQADVQSVTDDAPIPVTMDLGAMLYRIEFSEPVRRKSGEINKMFGGPSVPWFFMSYMNQGVIDVPCENDQEVWRAHQ